MGSKEIIVIGILFLLVGGSSYYIHNNYDFKNSESSNEVCINNKCFNVELAMTNEERQQGLMYRKSLGEDKGMLFIFSKEGVYPFWMKNTLIPLDIIWISESGKIVYIGENTLPCENDSCPSVNPRRNAMYVLEINGGLSEKYGFVVGDNVKFNIS